jgi:hypothetical protein
MYACRVGISVQVLKQETCIVVYLRELRTLLAVSDHT